MTNNTLYYRYDMIQANEHVPAKSKQFIYGEFLIHSESFHVFLYEDIRDKK